MRKVLEDFYYGNITPGEKEMQPGSKLQCAVDTAAQCESQLAERLDEVNQALLQCLFLGPLYWVAVAIPSVIWYHCFAGYRKKHDIPYDALFCERWATTWGKQWSGAGQELRHSKQ